MPPSRINDVTHRLLAMLAIAAVLLMSRPGLTAQTRPSQGVALQFMSSLVERASTAITNGDGSLETREKAYRELLSDGFDMKFIARISLGKYWRRISKAERQAYIDLFAEFVLKSYAPRLGGFDPSRFHVNDAVERGKKDMLVRTSIDQPSGPAIAAGWRVRLVKGSPKIVDIVVEGVSMAINQRREFVSVMSRTGISGLMEMLRARTGQLTVEPPA
jgi:phospholipid transport system substrate-binding protein